MQIRLTIEKKGGGEAILKDENGALLRWPEEKLPAGAKEKDAVIFDINTPEEAGGKNDSLAKKILNEILNGG